MKALIYICLILSLLAGCAHYQDTSANEAVEVVLADNMRQGYTEEITLGDLLVMGMVDSEHVFNAREVRDFNKYADTAKWMPNDRFQAVVKTYLIKNGKTNILIDSGWGKELDHNGQTEEILGRNGLSPVDIDAIVLTHMDVDHLGGLVRDGKPVYPVATLYISAPEFNAWNKGNVNRSRAEIERAAATAKAYKGRIKLFEFEEEFLPGITARKATGHTPGHTVVDVDSKGAGLSIVGDLVHIAPVQMAHPDIATIYDTVPEASQSRAKTFERIANGKRKIAGMHFPDVGRLQKTQTGGYALLGAGNE